MGGVVYVGVAYRNLNIDGFHIEDFSTCQL